MNKRWKKRGILVFALLCAGTGVLLMINLRPNSRSFEESSRAIVNPLMGYAPMADGTELSEDVSLVYVDITWRELEPREGVFAWEEIETSNKLGDWKKSGRHAVLRFVLDMPGSEKHMDIPDWLYEKTGGSGTWYDMEYGRGFAPDYSDETLIKYHRRAVKALGAYFGGDGFVSFVELGSLGHWGEWHVNYDTGIQRLPDKEVREEYIKPWTEAFPEADILMRRPFTAAAVHGFGLYNDMAGEPDSTKEWLSWIRDGGDYDQTREKSGLRAMPDFWKSAPSGGELTSSLSMEKILGDDLSETVKMIKDSHTTFLGPKTAEQSMEKGYNELLKNMGYRLWISKAVLKNVDGESRLELTWKNTGAAPFYRDWQVMAYISARGETLAEIPLEVELTQIMPGESIKSSTVIPVQGIAKWKKNGYKIAVGIIDPMTGAQAVKLAVKGMEDTVMPVLFE